MHDRNSFFINISIFIMLICIQGCAILQNSPVMEIHPSRLTGSNPNMVDGDLSTIGTFEAKGKILKKYFANKSLQASSNPKNYQVEIDGTIKTNTLIKLDKPTYIAYIEVHTASDIPKIALDFTEEEKSQQLNNSFIQVQQHRNTDVKNHKVIRYDIRHKILYLRITADGIEDIKNKTQKNSSDSIYRNETITPLKGGKIREVKFYERL